MPINNAPLCTVDGCTRELKADREGTIRSKLCPKHNTHNKRHGHPTRKQPSLRSHNDIKTSFLAGLRWARKQDLQEIINWFDFEFLQASKRTFSPHRHKSEYEPRELWAFHLNHLKSLGVSSKELSIRLTALSWVVVANPTCFHGDDFAALFITKKLLTIKSLPRHNMDAFSKVSKPYGDMSIAFARWMGTRLFDVAYCFTNEEIEEVTKLEYTSRKQTIANKGRNNTAQRRRTKPTSSDEGKVLMVDPLNQTHFWRYPDGRLEPA